MCLQNARCYYFTTHGPWNGPHLISKGECTLSTITQEIIKKGRERGRRQTTMERAFSLLTIGFLVFLLIKADHQEKEITAQTTIQIIKKTSPRITGINLIPVQDPSKAVMRIKFSGTPCVGELFFSQQLCGEWLKFRGMKSTPSAVRFDEKNESVSMTFNIERNGIDREFCSRITSFEIEDGLYTATCAGEMDESQIDFAQKLCGKHFMVEKPARMYMTQCIPSLPVVKGNTASFKINPIKLSSR